jgi:hypothetical protein
MPPGSTRLALAALGTLALAVGLVAALNGRAVGLLVALLGGALLAWSVYGRRLRS